MSEVVLLSVFSCIIYNLIAPMIDICVTQIQSNAMLNTWVIKSYLVLIGYFIYLVYEERISWKKQKIEK